MSRSWAAVDDRRSSRELRELGHGAHAIEADVSSEDGLVGAVARAEELLGGIDLFVNNAAGTWHQPLSHVTRDAWERTLATNVGACVYGCREVSRRWIADGHSRLDRHRRFDRHRQRPAT